MTRAQVRVRELSVVLTAGPPVVDGVSFEIAPGQVIGLVGESGSGKTTLGLALMGYTRQGTRIAGGAIEIHGSEITGLRRRQLRQIRGNLVAYVPQDPATALNPSLSLGTQLLEGASNRGQRAERRARASALLERAGFPPDVSILKRRPRELSGGQQQRVAIVMALMRKPHLVVLDEPTTGLDVVTQSQVLDLVRELCASEQTAVLYISHDLAVVSRIADRIAVMYAGRFLEQGPPNRVLTTPVHPYTRALLRAVPAVHERLDVATIPGRAPRVEEISRGCTFAPRCAYAMPVCLAEEPKLVVASRGHEVRCVMPDSLRNTEREKRDVLEEPAAIDATPVVLSVDDLSARHGDRSVVSGISFSVRRGECVALVGESGSGKTTLSRSLVGLHRDWDGRVELHGTRLERRAAERSPRARRALQYIFQNPYASLNPRRSVGHTLLETARHFFDGKTSGPLEGNAASERIAGALTRVELPEDLVDRYPGELSGGQRQRVAIARALLSEPDVLICDEITSALDVSVQAAIIKLLQGLRADGLAVVFVTHNLAVVRSIADRVLVMNEGQIVESGGAATVFTRPKDPYTRALMTHTPTVLR